jgi:hypothetical protein
MCAKLAEGGATEADKAIKVTDFREVVRDTIAFASDEKWTRYFNIHDSSDLELNRLRIFCLSIVIVISEVLHHLELVPP